MEYSIPSRKGPRPSAAPQYSLYGSTTTLLSSATESMRYGPEPTGLLLKSWPSFSIASGDGIAPEMVAMLATIGPYWGCFSLKTTDCSSGVCTESTCDHWLKMRLLAPSWSVRSTLRFTALALNDVPSWNFTPWRS